MKKYLNLVKSLAKVNYDNRTEFVRRDRLDAIANALEGTNWKKVNDTGLFELYAQNGVLPPKAVVISTHADCVDAITQCFANQQEGGYWLGTFDNLITNAMAVYLMKNGNLHSDVIVAFTGDEEHGSNGAAEVADYLIARGCKISTIVLDVTGMGWDEGAYFSVENNFWDDAFGETVIGAAKTAECPWSFVPSDVNAIPAYVPAQTVIHFDAQPDESWRYDEMGIRCFSYCIPTQGDMHTNEGILVRETSVKAYTDMLGKIANALANN